MKNNRGEGEEVFSCYRVFPECPRRVEDVVSRKFLCELINIFTALAPHSRDDIIWIYVAFRTSPGAEWIFGVEQRGSADLLPYPSCVCICIFFIIYRGGGAYFYSKKMSG